ncbi:MAG TPA: TonB-dependent receptor [Blastocatellia bacterium]|nr:TonB-dependent receptor [Blastocatellia bacterium]
MRIKFKRLLLALAMLALGANMISPVLAQNPTGSIRGTITDQSGAVITNATITVTNKATGDVRKASTGNDGIYAVTNLLPGEYEVKIEAQGFSTQNITALVQVGNTTTGDATLRAGSVGEVVDVVAEAPIIDKQNYKIDGVVTRQKIDALPLNGRNFLQLAQLEPGVGVSTSNVGNANNLFNVSVGGAPSALTRITVDGGSVLDPVTGGAAQNFSTETIQEFQISTFNFDLSTGLTSVGSVNIVSRTGTNSFHGNAFLYYRDHSFSALPTFFRPNRNFDPFFRRYQYGGAVGGPIKKDRAFFFGNIEKLRQRSAISTFITGSPALQQFSNTFTSPYDGTLVNIRTDYKVNDRNNLFVRYSLDDNDAFAPVENNRMPSNWRANSNLDHNIQTGLTTILRQNVVNDVRFNYQRIENESNPPSESDCPSTNFACIGARGPQIRVNGSNFVIGNHDQAPQARFLDRYQTRDDLNWQKGAHRIRFGGEWEHNYGKGLWDFFDPALMVLHDPRDVEAVNAGINSVPSALLPEPVKALLRIPLPASLATSSATKPTLNDILQLPLILALAGVGDPSQPPPFQTNIARQSNRYRFYAQDSWLVRPGLTFSFGASYQYETNLANHDLTRPELLRPLVGNIGHAPKDKNNIAPSLGFAWDIGNKGKTVIRGGAGMYYDTALFVTRLLERPLLGPAGDGRLSVPSAFFQNTVYDKLPINFPLGPIYGFNFINPARGASLLFLNNVILPNGVAAGTIPTKFTGANLLGALNAQVPVLQGILAAGASQGFSSVQFVKSAALPATLLDPNLESPYSEQFSIGVQRQLPHNMAISADFVLRNRLHIINAFGQGRGTGATLDLNKFNRSAAKGGPVLPKCTAAQAVNPTAICSNGPMPVIQSIDRNQYRALLIKVDKRFSDRYQFTASYALSSLKGFFINEDLDNWFGNHGFLEDDARHRLTVSGLVNLPKGFQASVIAVYVSRAPFNARVPDTVDINGDGTFADTLPGLKINSLNRGTSKETLLQLVNNYNANIAKPSGGLIKPLIVAPDFEFGDDFHSEDLRISKEIRFKERFAIQGFAEVFNIFNISNLTGYSTTLDQGNFAAPTDPNNNTIIPPSTFRFGRPTQRQGQAFGTGGPRAFQFGARFVF